MTLYLEIIVIDRTKLVSKQKKRQVLMFSHVGVLPLVRPRVNWKLRNDWKSNYMVTVSISKTLENIPLVL